MSRFAFRCIAAGLLTVLASPAVCQTVPSSFDNLQRALGEVATAQPRQEQLLTRIAEDAVALQIASPQIPAGAQAEFAKSIDYNAQLLQKAENAADPQAAAILADVADDLEVKRLASGAMAAGSAFPGRVKVRVVTIRNGAPTPGYVVTMNPVRWQSAQPLYRLPSLSPAAGEVPPGRYEVAALLGNSVKARDIVRVGLAAEDEVKIELPVP